MAELIINRVLEGLFEHKLDGVQLAIDNRPNLTTFEILETGIISFHFKTKNGAPLVKNQEIHPEEITITDTFGGTPTQTGFTNSVQVWNALGGLGYFEGYSGSGAGAGGIEYFKQLLDVFPNSFTGQNNKVYVVNEAMNRLEPVFLYNYNRLVQMQDVETIPADDIPNGYVLTSVTYIDSNGVAQKIFGFRPQSIMSQTPNGFIVLGSFDLTDGVFTADTSWLWSQDGIEYGNLQEYEYTIEDLPDGSSRFYVFHTQPNSNSFDVTVGNISTDGNALKPIIPLGSIELTTIFVNGSVISEPTTPITGSDYLTKYSRRDALNGETGENILLPSPTSVNGTRLVGSGLVSVDGYISGGFSEPVLGDLFPITNETGGNVILNDSATFITGNLSLPDGKVAIFRYEGSGVYRLVASSAMTGNYIPLSGTEEGSPITGDIEISNNPCEKSIFSKSGDDLIKLAFDIEDDQFYLERYKSGNSNRLHFTEGYLLVENTSDGAKGLLGNAEFDKQGDRKAYAQISDVLSVLSNDITKAKIEGDFIYGILDQYTGQEITLSKITSIPTGNTVDNIIYFQLESEFFKRVFTQYNIQWFGAKPDGSDCTEAIQSCINSCFYAGGGTILTPHGVYDIAGPLVTSDNNGNNPNSQLYIPGKKDVAFPGGTDTVISIKFIGSETPTMIASGFTDDKINLITDGCFWKSTLPYSSISGVLPSVIGTKGDNPTYDFNIIDVVFEDMWIRTHHDSTVGTYMTAFNMLDAAFSTFNRCRADIDVSGWNTVEHQNMSIGIAPTKSNGGTTVVATNSTSYGYNIGYTVGEHSYYENLNANFCNYAYDISKAGHGSLITRCLAQWNKVILSFNKYDNGYPTAFHFININELVVENVALGKWYDSVIDVEDPTNGIQGNCFFTKTVSGAGVFPTTLLTKNGGAKLNDRHITLPLVVVESDAEIKKITIKNSLPTSPFAYSALDFFGGGSIDNSNKFQLGQFSEGTAFFFNVGNKPIDFYTNSLKRLSLNADGTATFASTVQIANATASNHAVTLGQVQTEITVISDTTVALAVPNLYKWYSITGSGALASLPPIAGNEGKTIYIVNKSASVQNLYSNDSVSNDIWSNGVAVNTVAMPIGFVGKLFNDTVNWVLS